MKFLYLSSLGFMMMSPILISVYVGLYLKDIFNLPDLTIIFFILFGVFSGAYSVYKIIMGKGNSNGK